MGITLNLELDIYERSPFEGFYDVWSAVYSTNHLKYSTVAVFLRV
jgi:hypothetical protein